MQRDFGDFEDRCYRFGTQVSDGGLGNSKAALKRLTELVANVHAQCGAAPPGSLLKPLITGLLPNLSDSLQDRKIARLVYTLAGLVVSACKLEDLQLCLATLERLELHHENNIRRCAALKLYGQILKVEERRGESIASHHLSTFVQTVEKALVDSSGDGDIKPSNSSSSTHSVGALSASKGSAPRRPSLKSIISRRRGGKGEANLSKLVSEDGFNVSLSILAILRCTRVNLSAHPSLLNLVVNTLCSDNPSMACQAALLILLHLRENGVDPFVSRLLPLLPNGVSTSPERLNLVDQRGKLTWLKICTEIVISDGSDASHRQEFFLSLASHLLDTDEMIRVASVSCISRCPWELCSSTELDEDDHTFVLDVLVETIESLLSSPGLLSQPQLVLLFKSIQKLAETHAVHRSDSEVDVKWFNFCAAWKDVAALCQTSSTVDFKLEGIKTVVWIGQDASPSTQQPTAFAREVEFLCSSLTSEQLQTVFLTFQKRLSYEPGIAHALLHVAFQRLVTDTASINLDTVLHVWEHVLAHSFEDCTDAFSVKMQVLRQVYWLVDSPETIEWKAAVFSFLDSNIACFVPAGPSVHQLKHVRELIQRLMRGVYFESWATSRLCTKCLCRILLQVPTPLETDLCRSLQALLLDSDISHVHDILMPLLTLIAQSIQPHQQDQLFKLLRQSL